MKKICLILFLILFASFAIAGHIQQMHMMIINQEQPSGGGSECPTGYASSTFSWDGDHSSGVLYGCNSSGDAVLGTDNSSDTSDSYGEGGGDIAINIATNQNIRWTNSSYIDCQSGAYTVWFRIDVSATPDAECDFLEVSQGWTNRFYPKIEPTTRYETGLWEGNDVIQNISPTASAVPTGYTDIAISFDVTNDYASVNANSTWTDTSSPTITAFSTQAAYIYIGEGPYATSCAPGAGKHVYVTQFNIISGYKASKPW